MAKVYGVFAKDDGSLMGVNVESTAEPLRVLALCETEEAAQKLKVEIESEWNGEFVVASLDLDLGSAKIIL